jgi:hypothetical protein
MTTPPSDDRTPPSYTTPRGRAGRRSPHRASQWSPQQTPWPQQTGPWQQPVAQRAPTRWRSSHS